MNFDVVLGSAARTTVAPLAKTWLQAVLPAPQLMRPPVIEPRPPPKAAAAAVSRYSTGGSSVPSTSIVTVIESDSGTLGYAQPTVFVPWMRSVLPSGRSVGSGSGIQCHGSVPLQMPDHGGLSASS